MEKAAALGKAEETGGQAQTGRFPSTKTDFARRFAGIGGGFRVGKHNEDEKMNASLNIYISWNYTT